MEDRNRAAAHGVAATPGAGPPLQLAAAVDDEAARHVAWLQAVAKRDQPAFERLYAATLARVHALARRICIEAALTEEVVEDVYVQVWRDAQRFDAARGAPLAWMLMITRSRALDALRRRDDAAAITPALLESLESDGADPLHLLATFQAASATRCALEALPASERQLVALAFMRGLTHPEIAHATGLPLGTVKTKIRRALSTLKTLLQPHAPQPIDASAQSGGSERARNGSKGHEHDE